MNLKKIKGLWFYGLSGSGKSFASKFIKKKIKNSILLDGDRIRKYISFDLGYTEKDRKIQIIRVYGLVKLSLESNLFPIVSTVYMNEQLKKKLKKNKILLINIIRDFSKIKNRKLIYNKRVKNVVGVDIKLPRIDKNLKIYNNENIESFKKKIIKIIYER